MVELSEEVAEQLRNHYGDEVVTEYQDLMPSEIASDYHDAYDRTEDLAGYMHPDRIGEMASDDGLAPTIEYINETAEDWREAALVIAMNYRLIDAGLEERDQWWGPDTKRAPLDDIEEGILRDDDITL